MSVNLQKVRHEAWCTESLVIYKSLARELLSNGNMIIDYVESKDNVSDPLTKCVTRDGVDRLLKGIGIWPRTSHCSGKST